MVKIDWIGILNAMGGQYRLKVMVNARDFVKNDSENWMGFKFSGNRGGNYVKIYYENATDTFKMVFMKITLKEWKEVYSFSGLYVDMLKNVFEENTSLRLSL